MTKPAQERLDELEARLWSYHEALENALEEDRSERHWWVADAIMDLRMSLTFAVALPLLIFIAYRLTQALSLGWLLSAVLYVIAGALSHVAAMLVGYKSTSTSARMRKSLATLPSWARQSGG